MKFSIRGLIFFTLLTAVVANAVTQWKRLKNVQADITGLYSEVEKLNFDAAYINSHTKVCERAIANNPLPSPFYVAARDRSERLLNAKRDDNP